MAEMAQALGEKARAYSLDTGRVSPFEIMARDADIRWNGGIPDDTTGSFTSFISFFKHTFFVFFFVSSVVLVRVCDNLNRQKEAYEGFTDASMPGAFKEQVYKQMYG